MRLLIYKTIYSHFKIKINNKNLEIKRKGVKPK